jgi:hypothetical protein
VTGGGTFSVRHNDFPASSAAGFDSSNQEKQQKENKYGN